MGVCKRGVCFDENTIVVDEVEVCELRNRKRYFAEEAAGGKPPRGRHVVVGRRASERKKRGDQERESNPDDRDKQTNKTFYD